VLRAIVLDIYRQLHEKDKAYWRTSREKRFGTTLEQYGADPAKAVAELRAALEPLRPALAENAFVSGKGPGFADYILFGMFQWARCVSPLPLLEAGDPLHAWRGRVLELWGGYAGKAKGYPV
jgi:glutathione S-transferase